MTQAQWAKFIQESLAKRYPVSTTLLEYRNPWELLVATILAAQCTDARVNTITPEFFKRWPNPEDLAQASREEIEELIRPTGFFHNKAKNLQACSREVMDRFKGKLPKTMSELVTLPGIARKTANVVLFAGFGINEGIAVDTHVRRISYRMGLTESQDPIAIEQDLMPLFPREEWGNLNMRLVAFGREICKARKPDCQNCDLAAFCPKKEPPKKKA